MTHVAAPITIRPGYADDRLAVARLAALDSAEIAPTAPLLVAEIDGELRVAMSLHDGSAIADPFFPTADILTLLRTHAAAITAPVTRRRLHSWVRLRARTTRQGFLPDPDVAHTTRNATES